MQKAIEQVKKSQKMPAKFFFNVLLGEVERLLESPISYFASVEDNEHTLIMRGWSRNVMDACSTIEKPLVYKLEETGLWGDAVRERGIVITNDYKGCKKPTKKGHPEGHVNVVRHMNIPITKNGVIVGVTGVGNKATDYTEADGKKLIEIMDKVWDIVATKCTERPDR